MAGALEAAVLHFVVEGQLVAQAACGGREMDGDLVGVGAVGRQQPCRKAERGKLGEAVDHIRAGALARGVQDQTEHELRMPADAFTGPRVGGGVPSARSDQKRGGVSEDSLLGPSAVVPARGDVDGGETPPFAVRVVPCRDWGGVGADIALPALEQTPAVGEADADQRQTVADLLQYLPPPLALGVVVLPGAGHGSGLMGGQPTAPVTALGVEGRGQPVEGLVDAAGERDPGVLVAPAAVRDAEPGPCGGPQLIDQHPADIREAGAVVVVQREQQPHQHGPDREPFRARSAFQFVVDQLKGSGLAEKRAELADLGVGDQRGCVGDRPRPALPDLLRAPPGPGLGHRRSGPRRSRAAVASSTGGTRCCQRARDAEDASPAAWAIRW